jgi:hypothetical protein
MAEREEETKADADADPPREGSVGAQRRQRDAAGGPAATRSADGAGSASAETETDSQSETESNATPPLPGAGTPEGDALQEADAAFTRGDYVRVRELTEKLIGAPDDSVARYARDLLSRTEVDPVQVGVVLACLALFAYIVYTYVLS